MFGCPLQTRDFFFTGVKVIATPEMYGDVWTSKGGSSLRLKGEVIRFEITVQPAHDNHTWDSKIVKMSFMQQKFNCNIKFGVDISRWSEVTEAKKPNWDHKIVVLIERDHYSEWSFSQI